MSKKQMVVGFMFSRSGESVVLIEKQKPAWQKGLLNGVGGKIEAEDFTPIAAMVREFKEETGAETTQDMWEPFAKMEGDDWEVYCLCGFSNIAYQCKTTEEEKVLHLSLDKLHEHVTIDNIPALIELALLRRNKSGFNVSVLDYTTSTL